jgi:hypothetical protein
MIRISFRVWIREHREELDTYIRRACPNIPRLNDDERLLWILNDEGLYNWVRSEGVKV